MSREEISVRQWQEQFKAGTFDSPDIHTQCGAGWYDWFCQDKALAGRLKKIAKVVMGITNPFILDHYYIWFKNNALVSVPLYDDVRFEPLSGKRDGKYFLVALDYPPVKEKWTLFTERYGFEAPEFVCGSVRNMIPYVNQLGAELESGAPSPLTAEEKAVSAYIASQPDLRGFTGLHRVSGHTYSVFIPSEDRKELIHAALNPACAPVGFQEEQVVRIDGIYVSRHDHEVKADPDLGRSRRKNPPKRGGPQR